MCNDVWTGFPLAWWDRGKKEYEPPRYMTINTALEQLLEVEEAQQGGGMYMFFTCCIKYVLFCGSCKVIDQGINTMKFLWYFNVSFFVFSLR